MVVPPVSTELVLWASVVVLTLMVVAGFITLAESIVRLINDRRQEAVQSDVRFGMLERMTSVDPDWETWVDGLSAVERTVTRTQLESYLRSTRGAERERLQELGRTLGIPAEAKQTLRDGKRHKQLQALTWLTLLEEPVDEERLRSVCTADSGLRAAGARLLYETDHPDARPIGTDLLVGDSDTTLSVYGLDTLYLLHRDDPTPLLERAKTAHTEWRPSLVIQVLTVIRHCGIAGRDAPLAWIVELTDHDLPTIRAAAALALAPEGWRSSLRETVDAEALCVDPDAETRRAVYTMLAEWGDRPALETLSEAARSETDQRSQVHALERLYGTAVSPPRPTDGTDDEDYDRAWRWVRANKEVAPSS
ncbi:MAG: HEAT repeat domain-containing protein [Halobacteriales archaeon]